MPRPFVKWVGGKGALLAQLDPLLPSMARGNRYWEPFVGGGAMFFHLHRRNLGLRAGLFDRNEELVKTWCALKKRPDDVLAALEKHAAEHGRAHYYDVRARKTDSLSDIEIAARFIYLNRTGFNGLYRVNSRGGFNVPMGRYTRPRILDEDNVRAVHTALQTVDCIQKADFRALADRARKDDFVYFDPPYVPLSRTAYFTSYTDTDFGEDDQRDLADLYRVLHDRGCRLMLSNSHTRLVKALYKHEDFQIRKVMAPRNVNSRTDARGRVAELVVINYRPASEGA